MGYGKALGKSKKRHLVNRWVLVISSLLFLLLAAAAWLYIGSRTLKIGVLLPLTGPDKIDSDEVLDWAVNRINANGGINGRKVDIIYKDQNKGDTVELAEQLLADKSIKIVIGPMESSNVYRIAPLFIEKKKILISPTATSGDIFRMFGKKRFFWRTVQGDVTQIRIIMHILNSRGVKKVALVYRDDAYGKTFYDWAGFFAIEMGMELLSLNRFVPDSDVSSAVAEALKGNPEYIIGVAFPEDAVRIRKEIDRLNSSVKLFFTDGAESQYVTDRLGEGTELTTPSADPNCGFEEAYKEEYGYFPWDYASTTYDSFLMAVYTLARQEYSRRHFRFERIEDSMHKVVFGRDGSYKWNQTSEVISEILKGRLPDINGASGTLDFDSEHGVDPLETYYGHNIVETREGYTDFWRVSSMSSKESLKYGRLEEDASAARTKGSGKYALLEKETKEIEELAGRKGLWAVIIATSSGWKNYRHQADALAFYDLLKQNGVNDNNIILFLIDDMPWTKENPIKGDVHHMPKGRNLRSDAKVDYYGEGVIIENLRNVLLGNKTEKTPVVLESSSSDNVLLYIVDHGMPGFIPFESGLLSAAELASITDEMHSRERFRQMLIIVEVCFGESIGLNITTPHVVYLTGAAKTETSFGATYDHNIRQWLADDFSLNTFNTIRKNPYISIRELYTSVYNEVFGSHVRLVNYENFGSLDAPIKEFVAP